MTANCTQLQDSLLLSAPIQWLCPGLPDPATHQTLRYIHPPLDDSGLQGGSWAQEAVRRGAGLILGSGVQGGRFLSRGLYDETQFGNNTLVALWRGGYSLGRWRTQKKKNILGAGSLGLGKRKMKKPTQGFSWALERQRCLCLRSEESGG